MWGRQQITRSLLTLNSTWKFVRHELVWQLQSILVTPESGTWPGVFMFKCKQGWLTDSFHWKCKKITERESKLKMRRFLENWVCKRQINKRNHLEMFLLNCSCTPCVSSKHHHIPKPIQRPLWLLLDVVRVLRVSAFSALHKQDHLHGKASLPGAFHPVNNWTENC